MIKKGHSSTVDESRICPYTLESFEDCAEKTTGKSICPYIEEPCVIHNSQIIKNFGFEDFDGIIRKVKLHMGT